MNSNNVEFESGKELLGSLRKNAVKDQLIQNSNGLQDYASQIFDKLECSPFTSCIGDNPKGLLLHGPPRVGKTFISKKLIQYLQFFTVQPDLAAGGLQ